MQIVEPQLDSGSPFFFLEEDAAIYSVSVQAPEKCLAKGFRTVGWTDFDMITENQDKCLVCCQLSNNLQRCPGQHRTSQKPF
jgi:hypothetical protein